MRSLPLLGAGTEERENSRDNHFTELEIHNTQPDMVHSEAILMKLAGEKLTLALYSFPSVSLRIFFFKNSVFITGLIIALKS